jgi:hypothetical protein
MPQKTGADECYGDTIFDGGSKTQMQQVQDKQSQQQKAQPSLNHDQLTPAYRPSPMPMILATSAKVCYGFSALALAASVVVWNSPGFPKFSFSKKQNKNAPKKAVVAKPTERQYHESQRLGSFVGLLTPTFALAGKILDDASARVAQHEIAQWEKRQAEKARTTAFRFFSR